MPIDCEEGNLMPQPVIFISYSHKDEKEKDRLLSHLGVLQGEGLIDLWSDDRIGAGADWEQEINEAMTQARVAILLISVSFLNSGFILGKEVPALLKRRQDEGLTVFPVIAKACVWEEVEWLTKMNVRPKYGRPIWGAGGRRVDEDLAEIAKEVAAIVKTSPLIAPTVSTVYGKSERPTEARKAEIAKLKMEVEALERSDAEQEAANARSGLVIQVPQRLLQGHHFISYSSIDGQDFALKLYDALSANGIPVWLDKRDVQEPEFNWDEEVLEALRTCKSLLFLMTPNSIERHANCTLQWRRALKYKKTIILVRFDHEVERPLGLGNRQIVEFTNDFRSSLQSLRSRLENLDTPDGILKTLQDRLGDAEHDLHRVQDPIEQRRIEQEISWLKEQIKNQKRTAQNPKKAAHEAEKKIKQQLRAERQPFTTHKTTGTLVVNLPPSPVPDYFQGRVFETKRLGDFLKNPQYSLMIITGRGGIGKTVLVCRVLKEVAEKGQLPDEGGPLAAGGVVYLSARGATRLDVPNLYTTLLKLLPEEEATRLEGFYRNSQTTTTVKIQHLLEAFPSADGADNSTPTILLLDNFETLLDPATQEIADTELDEALQAILSTADHSLKVIMTTRITPQSLAVIHTGRRILLPIRMGLTPSEAVDMLRQLDQDGLAGLRDADDASMTAACERTQGYPRALEALHAALAADRTTNLAEILDDTEHLLPENVVEDLIGEAFNRLDPAAQQVMQALAIYNRPVTAIAIDVMLQPYQPGLRSEPILRRLANMQFIHYEEQRFSLHPVDRAYALARVNLGDEQDRKLIRTDRPPFTQLALYHLGANYFQKARKPRPFWKTIDDLAPQLAEFDLRYAGQDYDTAAEVLLEVDFDYLMLWGHYRLISGLYERLQDKLTDPKLIRSIMINQSSAYITLGQIQKSIGYAEKVLKMARAVKSRGTESAALGNLGNAYSVLGQTTRAIEYYTQALAISREISNRRGEGVYLGNLGSAYSDLGQTTRAIEYHEQALAISQETGDRQGEGAELGSLGSAYSVLGQTTRAIEYHEQALAINREVGDRQGEGTDLSDLGIAYSDLGQITRAIEYYKQALAIKREVGNRAGESGSFTCLARAMLDEARYSEAVQYGLESVKIAQEVGGPASPGNVMLGLAYLYNADLLAARAAAEVARQYDEPTNNHHALALLGVITLRQGDILAAQEAFNVAIAHADKILSYTPQYFDALDVKGLALCGLALCATEPKIPELALDSSENYIGQAKEEYRAARAITKAAGIVGRVLRLFDALAVVDEKDILAQVRPVAAGEI
jgi:tetratricopeptide (TPR) repeat protein